MIKNNKANEQKNLSNSNKESLGKKIKRKLIFFIIILGIIGSVWVAVKSSVQNHALKPIIKKVENSTTAKSVDERLTLLENEIATLKNNTPSVVNSEEIAEYVRQSINSLRQELKQNMAELENKFVPNAQNSAVSVGDEKISQEMLLANGAIMVRDLAEKGLPFAYEAEVLQILAQGNEPAANYVHVIQQYAASGVKGKHSLIEAYKQFYNSFTAQKVETLLATDNVQETKQLSWDKKVWNWFKSLIVRKKKEAKQVFVAKEDKVYELVNSGNLAEALTTMQTDAKYSQFNDKFLHQWQEQVQNYLNFETAVSGLIMNSLANIHLKEMDH